MEYNRGNDEYRGLEQTVISINIPDLLNQDEAVFQVDFEKLKETIAAVKQDLCFEIYAYCFMSNHVHIVLKEKNFGLLIIILIIMDIILLWAEKARQNMIMTKYISYGLKERLRKN